MADKEKPLTLTGGSGDQALINAAYMGAKAGPSNAELFIDLFDKARTSYKTSKEAAKAEAEAEAEAERLE